MISLMKEAKLQGVTSVKAWTCTLPVLPTRPSSRHPSEGLYVGLPVPAVRGGKSNKMLATFLGVRRPDKADGFGAQAWAASVLFAESDRRGGRAGRQQRRDPGANLLSGVKTMKDFKRRRPMVGTITPRREDAEPVRSFVEQVRGQVSSASSRRRRGTFDAARKNSLSKMQSDSE